MKLQGFKDLSVWNKAHLLVLDIYKITRSFPGEEKYCLVNQIRRSAISISANIVEGYRKSKKDFARYIDIAQASLEETKYHLILSKDLEYFDNTDYERLMPMAEEVGKMLHGLKRSLQSNN